MDYLIQGQAPQPPLVQLRPIFLHSATQQQITHSLGHALSFSLLPPPLSRYFFSTLDHQMRRHTLSRLRLSRIVSRLSMLLPRTAKLSFKSSWRPFTLSSPRFIATLASTRSTTSRIKNKKRSTTANKTRKIFF
jgi:hypothetical protein